MLTSLVRDLVLLGDRVNDGSDETVFDIVIVCDPDGVAVTELVTSDDSEIVVVGSVEAE